MEGRGLYPLEEVRKFSSGLNRFRKLNDRYRSICDDNAK